MNNKISAAQTQALIIISALGFEILILPMVITGFFQLAAALVTGFVFCILAVCSNINIYESKPLCYIYSAKNILAVVLLTKILADTVKDVMLENMLIYKIILMIVFVTGYAAFKGIEATARIGQMLFWFVVIGTAYVYLMSVPDMELSNVFVGTGLKSGAVGCALGLVVNTAEIIILLKPNMRKNSGEVLKGAAVSLVLVLAIGFVIMGRLGVKGMNQVKYPLFEIMYTADLPNIFIKRQEGIFISLWIISALISVFIYFTTAVEFMSVMNINRRNSVILLMVFVFIFASVYSGSMRAIRTYCFLQIIGGIFTVGLIPLVYVFRRNKIE